MYHIKQVNGSHRRPSPPTHNFYFADPPYSFRLTRSETKRNNVIDLINGNILNEHGTPEQKSKIIQKQLKTQKKTGIHSIRSAAVATRPMLRIVTQSHIVDILQSLRSRFNGCDGRHRSC